MKMMRFALGALTCCGLMVQQASAQQTSRPSSIQEVTYKYFLDEGDADKSAAQKGKKKAAQKSAAQKGKKSAAQKSASKAKCGCDDANGKGKGGLSFLNRMCVEHKAPWSLADHGKKGKGHGISISGHTQLGWHDDGENGGGVANSFNDNPHSLQLHQQWLTVAKAAQGGGDVDWGFRMDWLYGTDGPDAQSFGNAAGEWDEAWDNGGNYGHALPQLYAEVAMGDLRVKGGHFLSPLGYESVNSTENFFYSRSYGRGIAGFIPRTVTGVQVDYTVGENLTAHGGWVNGEDPGFGSTNGSMFLGGATVALANGMDINYMLLSSDDVYAHSIAVARQLTDRIHTVFESVLRSDTTGSVQRSTQTQITLNNYVFYDLNDCMKLGLRSEWVDPGRGQEEYNAVTVGVNYQATANLMVRPELRMDNFHKEITDREDSTVFGFDAIWSY